MNIETCKAAMSAAVAAFLSVGPSTANAKPPAEGYTRTFHDDFGASSVDPKTWNFRTQVKALSAQVRENVVVENGSLNLTMKKKKAQGKEFTGSGIISTAKFRYGYFESRAKATNNSGWWTAFWLARGDGSDDFAEDSFFEIDVFEIDTRQPDKFRSGLMFFDGDDGQVPAAQPLCSSIAAPKIDTTERFHTYGADWREGIVDFYLDNELFCSLTYSPSDVPQDAVNIWLTTLGWAEPMDVGGRPQLVDYVSYYQKDYYLKSGEPGYTETGPKWRDSNLPGFGLTKQRQNCRSGASASWQVRIAKSGRYNVQIWKTADSNADPAADVQVDHSGGVSRQHHDFRTGGSGWLDLGTYDFKAGVESSVRVRLSSGCLRAGMVKFVRF